MILGGKGGVGRICRRGHAYYSRRLDYLPYPLFLHIDGHHEALEPEDHEVQQEQAQSGRGRFLADEINENAAVQITSRGLARERQGGDEV